MIIDRERYLDDGPEWHLSIAVQSRSLRMHSLLTALTTEGGTLDTIEEFPEEWTEACVRFLKEG